MSTKEKRCLSDLQKSLKYKPSNKLPTMCPLPLNCHDNAVVESFFQLLKRERIKRKIYTTREHARADISDYIAMFYNSRRKHGEANNIPPLAYEKLAEFKRKPV